MTFITVIIILSIDQLSKFLAVKNLALNEPRPVIDGFFYLTLVYNRGAAFGILQNQIPFFIICSLLALALIFMNLRKTGRRGKTGLYDFSLSLILAGGLGNLIDRLFSGHVIDFLDFRVWPVFNLADSAITTGVILLGWAILKGEK